MRKYNSVEHLKTMYFQVAMDFHSVRQLCREKSVSEINQEIIGPKSTASGMSLSPGFFLQFIADVKKVDAISRNADKKSNHRRLL